MAPERCYKSDDLDWLRKPDREVEGPWLERKQSFDRDEVARQISAFGNADPPGGLIVIGVTKDGDRLGLADQNAKARDGVAHIPVDSRDWTHRFVPVSDGSDEILFIRVPAATDRVVCRSDGTAFQRRGSSTIQLRSEEVSELKYKRDQVSFEDEPIVPFGEEVIDSAVANDLLKAMIEKNGITLDQTLEEALLNKGMAKKMADGMTHLTVAGYLAIGRQPTDLIPGARIHLQRFEGIQEAFGAQRNITKEIWFDGPTRQMLKSTLEAVQTILKDFDRLGSSGAFVHEPEYPRAAWEEAIVNAIVHRSYSIRNSPIEVRIFDDRFEVESPGGYPGPQRPTAEGVFPLSYPRNRRFGEALRYLNLVRLAREGTRRMSSEMAEMGLPPPDYKEIAGISVRVTLRNDLGRRRDRSVWSEIARDLDEDLAIYRRQAYQAWSGLGPATSAPPPEVLAKVRRMLDSPSSSVPPGQKRQLLAFLARAPAGTTSNMAVDWARTLQSTLLADWLVDGAIVPVVSQLIAQSDEAVELLLDSLSVQNVPTGEGQRLAFQTLVDRLRRPPLPPKEWMLRALAASRKYPSEISGQLQHEINGG